MAPKYFLPLNHRQMIHGWLEHSTPFIYKIDIAHFKISGLLFPNGFFPVKCRRTQSVNFTTQKKQAQCETTFHWPTDFY